MFDRLPVRVALLALAAAVLCGATPLTAATLDVTIHRHGLAGGDVLVRFIPLDGAAGRAPVQRSVASATTDLPLPLDAGTWAVEAHAEGAWHGRQYITVGGDRDLVVDLWPAGRVIGVITSNARSAPKLLHVAFEGQTPAGERLEGGSPCSLLGDGRFDCPVPAGRLDVRFAVPMHVARFLWGVKVTADEETNVGSLALLVGQSLVGRLETKERRKLDLSKAVVHASPAGLPESGGPILAGALILPRTVHALQNGIFQVDGVVPGTYRVRASHPAGLFTDEILVTVREGATATDIAQPLRLAQPRRITVFVTPAATPQGDRWRVSIQRITGQATYDPVSESLADAAGRWSSPTLPPGEYRLQVSASFEDVWREESVTLSSEDETRLIPVSSRRIAGRATLGGKGLKATVSFYDRDGASAKTESDQAGDFELLLPGNGSGRWDVVVAAASPFLNRRLDDMRVSPDSPLLLEIGGASLSGKVVDEQGAAVPNALVSIVTANATLQPSTGPDGVFVALGVQSGAVRISAEAPEEVADEMELNYDEADPPQPVTLTTHARRELHGEVESSLGPVAGAEVVVASIDPPAWRLAPTTTGADGTFTANLAHGAREVDLIVLAQGFSFVCRRIAVADGSPRLALDQRGGTLTIVAPAENAFLVHDGAVINLDFVRNRWPSDVTRTKSENLTTRTASMEPGVYTLCLVTPESQGTFIRSGGAAGGSRCSRGALDPLGSLTLDVGTPSRD